MGPRVAWQSPWVPCAEPEGREGHLGGDILKPGLAADYRHCRLLRSFPSGVDILHTGGRPR